MSNSNEIHNLKESAIYTLYANLTSQAVTKYGSTKSTYTLTNKLGNIAGKIDAIQARASTMSMTILANSVGNNEDLPPSIEHTYNYNTYAIELLPITPDGCKSKYTGQIVVPGNSTLDNVSTPIAGNHKKIPITDNFTIVTTPLSLPFTTPNTPITFM